MGETWWDEGDQLAIDLIARRDVEGSFRQTWPDRPIVKLLFGFFKLNQNLFKLCYKTLMGTWNQHEKAECGAC